MQGESRVEDVQPALHRHQFSTTPVKICTQPRLPTKIMISFPSARRFQQLGQRGVVDPASQIVAHQAKRLLAAEVVTLEQAEELMHVGHGTPLCVHERGVRVFSVSRDIGRFQRQRRIPAKIKRVSRSPGGEVGVIRGVNLQQGVARWSKN